MRCEPKLGRWYTPPPLPNFRLPGDISVGNRYDESHLVDRPFALNRDGTITVLSGTGIGAIVSEERHTARFEAFG